MPLKEIKEPAGKKPPRDAPREKTDPTEEIPDSPWKLEPDGTRVRKGRKLPYEKQIHQLLIEVSGGVALVDSFSAKAIELQSEQLAYGYARLAKEDPRVRALFEKLITGTAFSAALIPTLTLVGMIGWHFGFIPAKVGVPLTMASGMMPFTRGQEQEIKEKARRDQEEAEAHAPGGTHPRGEAPNGDGGGSAN
jgi:hypothetical protein